MNDFTYECLNCGNEHSLGYEHLFKSVPCPECGQEYFFTWEGPGVLMQKVESLPVVKFNKHYSKLDADQFSTIRIKNDGKYNEGDWYKIVTPKREFFALCAHVTIRLLNHIPPIVLMNDTDTNDYKSALQKIKDIYPNLKNDGVVYIISLYGGVVQDEN